MRIQHPPSNLPEVSINEGYSLATIYRAMVSKVIYTSAADQYSCCFTHINDDTDELTISKSLHVASTCGCHHAHTSSVETHSEPDTVLELFEIGETLYYANDGWSGLVKVKSFDFDENGTLQFVVTSLALEEDITTTTEHLRSPSNPDIFQVLEESG